MTNQDAGANQDTNGATNDYLLALTRAIDRLRLAEIEALKRIAETASAEDIKKYESLRDTLNTLETERHSRSSRIFALLKKLGFVPG